MKSAAQRALGRDILAPLDELNVGGEDAPVAPSEYLEVAITRV